MKRRGYGAQSSVEARSWSSVLVWRRSVQWRVERENGSTGIRKESRKKLPSDFGIGLHRPSVLPVAVMNPTLLAFAFSLQRADIIPTRDVRHPRQEAPSSRRSGLSSTRDLQTFGAAERVLNVHSSHMFQRHPAPSESIECE